MIEVYKNDNFQYFPDDFFSKTNSPGEFGYNGMTPDPTKVSLEYNAETGKYEIVLGLENESGTWKAGVIKTGGKCMPTPPFYLEAKIKLPAYEAGIFPAFWTRDWKVNTPVSWQTGDPIRVYGKHHDVSWDSGDSVNELDIFEAFGSASNWPTPTLTHGWHTWRPEYKQNVNSAPNALGDYISIQPLTTNEWAAYNTYGASVEFYDPSDRGKPLRKARIKYYFNGDLHSDANVLWAQDRPTDIIFNHGRHDSGSPPSGTKMKIASIGIYLLEDNI